MALSVIGPVNPGPRTSHEPDERRALDDKGRRQAERIADLLAPVGVERILTSRYLRCVETIEPLAARVGIVVEEHPALAEEAGLEQAWDLLESLAGTTAVVCSHGNILSPILDRVHRRGAAIEAEEWSCHKGSVWRLEPEGGRLFGRAVQDVVQA